MKIKKILLVLAISILPTIYTFADGPGGPGGGSNGNSAPVGFGGIPVGGGAPLDGGLSFLMLFGAAYGSGKIKGEKS